MKTGRQRWPPQVPTQPCGWGRAGGQFVHGVCGARQLGRRGAPWGFVLGGSAWHTAFTLNAHIGRGLAPHQLAQAAELIGEQPGIEAPAVEHRLVVSGELGDIGGQGPRLRLACGAGGGAGVADAKAGLYRSAGFHADPHARRFIELRGVQRLAAVEAQRAPVVRPVHAPEAHMGRNGCAHHVGDAGNLCGRGRPAQVDMQECTGLADPGVWKAHPAQHTVHAGCRSAFQQPGQACC